MDLKNIYTYLAILLFLMPVIDASDEAAGEDLNDKTAMGELINQVQVVELVDLICECRVEEACKEQRPQDCFDVQQAGNAQSGLYDIYPAYVEGPIQVYCDMDTAGGGWTVIQRRKDGLVDFYRDWESYKQGFGYAGSEFWLGNENIFAISNQADCEIRFDLEDFEGESRFAHYSYFCIGDEDTKYKLAINGYDGDAGDDMDYHDGLLFSTKDQDNDTYGTSCAVKFTSGWWYGDCHASHLNGQYLKGTMPDAAQRAKGVHWYKWKNHNYSLKRTEMKIRPVQTA